MRYFAPAALILSLAACSGQSEENEAIGYNIAATGANGAAAEAPFETVDAQPPGNESTAADSDPGDGGDLAIIPVRYHGEWNADRAACGTGASETRLRIDGDRLRFYESVGAVRRVKVESDRVIDVTAEYEGEGQTWQNERRLSLSADGDSLTVTGEGSSLVRYRCGAPVTS